MLEFGTHVSCTFILTDYFYCRPHYLLELHVHDSLRILKSYPLNHKITISSIVIGLKNSYFSTNSLAKLLLDSLLLDTVIEQFVIGQFSRPITIEVVFQINQSHSKL